MNKRNLFFLVFICLFGLFVLVFCYSPEKDKAQQNLDNWWKSNAQANWERTCHDRGNRIACIITRPGKDGVDMLSCYPDSCVYFDQDNL